MQDNPKRTNWSNVVHDINRTDVQGAVRDLKERTLEFIPGQVARLLYLASTRDYNTGRYYHDGLAFKFTNEGAEMALESAHRAAFEGLVFSPLEVVVQELCSFINSTHTEPKKVLETWKKLEPYRVVIPQNCDPVASELFFSNIRIALAVLDDRQSGSLPSQQSASQPQ